MDEAGELGAHGAGEVLVLGIARVDVGELVVVTQDFVEHVGAAHGVVGGS